MKSLHESCRCGVKPKRSSRMSPQLTIRVHDSTCTNPFSSRARYPPAISSMSGILHMYGVQLWSIYGVRYLLTGGINAYWLAPAYVTHHTFRNSRHASHCTTGRELLFETYPGLHERTRTEPRMSFSRHWNHFTTLPTITRVHLSRCLANIIGHSLGVSYVLGQLV